MSFVLRALRGNAHVLNYAMVGCVTIVPLLAYSYMRSPSSTQVEHTLVRASSPQPHTTILTSPHQRRPKLTRGRRRHGGRISAAPRTAPGCALQFDASP